MSGLSEGIIKEYFNIARLIHYPECWDTVSYPTLYSAIYEVWEACTTCKDLEKDE